MSYDSVVRGDKHYLFNAIEYISRDMTFAVFLSVNKKWVLFHKILRPYVSFHEFKFGRWAGRQGLML